MSYYILWAVEKEDGQEDCTKEVAFELDIKE